MRSSSTTNMSLHSASQPSTDDQMYYFALAEVKGEVHLVQISALTPPSALTLVDVKIFKHELATIFRHVQTTTLHPRDMRVIELIAEALIRYEEDTGTAFLVREMVDRMQKLTWRTIPPIGVAKKKPLSIRSEYGVLYAQLLSRKLELSGKLHEQLERR